MKVGTAIVGIALPVCAVLGLVVATTSEATSATPADGPVAPAATSTGLSPDVAAQVDAAKKALGVGGGASTEAAGLLVEGFDNINFGHLRIVDLWGPSPCSATGDDIDYAVENLGNNINSLASMRVRTSSCVVVLFDGPNFTGANWVAFTNCPNLGSCNGHNIWRRANSFYLT